MYRIIISSVLLIATLFAEEYELGQGLKVGELPLYIGGYGTVDYLQRVDDYKRFRMDDLGVMAYGSTERFSYLAAIETEKLYIKEWGKREGRSRSTKMVIERLYMDYQLDDSIKIRAGKYNTPIGYWNLEPIDILRDAASNPYLAFIVYPRYSTGLLVDYADKLNSNTSYSVILQENNDLDDDYNNILLDRHYGIGVEHSIDDSLSIKANTGYLKTKENENFVYGLLSLQYKEELYEITSELGFRRGEDHWNVPYAFYAEGVYHMSEGHDLIGRFEHYKIDEGAVRDEQIAIMGYTYRPSYPVALKFEYQAHTYTNENQFRFAFSIMF